MNVKKAVLYGMSLTAVAAVSVFGTLAYLTDKDSVANTFTVGNIEITLDEADVDVNGTPIANADRVKENKYHLIPGQSYTKDPTMTVKAGSEKSYVRALVTINCASQLDTIFAPDGGVELIDIFQGYDAGWIYKTETRDDTANTITYEFRYKDTVDGFDDTGAEKDKVLPALFKGFTVPGFFDGDDLKALAGLKIEVVGHAIQASTFKDGVDAAGNVLYTAEDAAWEAFDLQTNP